MEKEKKDNERKKVKLSIDLIIKIIAALIMIVFVLFLFNKNSDEFKVVTDVTSLKNSENTDFENGVKKEIEIPSVEKEGLEKTNSENFENSIVSEEKKDENVFNHRLISPEEYKEKLESGEYIHIDIRRPEEYNQEKIAEGLNINYYATDFRNKLDKLDKAKKYIYHCRSGSRTANSVPIFKELGFGEVLELEGGINN